MSAFSEFFLSCLAIALLAGLAIALLIVLGRRRRVGRSDREIIAELKDQPVVERIAALNDRSPRMRACAAAALADTKDPAAVEALIAGLNDTDPEVISTILKALAENGGVTAFDAFLDKLRSDDSIPYRSGLLPQGHTHRQDDVVEWLIGRAERGDPGALLAVGEFPTPRSVEYLIGLLRDQGIPLWERKRREAAESLARIYLSAGLGRIHKRLIEKLEEPVWFDPRTLNQGGKTGEAGAEASPSEMGMAEFIAMARTGPDHR